MEKRGFRETNGALDATVCCGLDVAASDGLGLAISELVAGRAVGIRLPGASVCLYHPIGRPAGLVGGFAVMDRRSSTTALRIHSAGRSYE